MAIRGLTALILGGGIGGIVAAQRLRRALPERYRIVLVEREPRFVFAPSLLWLMSGQRTANEISRPMGLVERRGIEVVRGEVQDIDPERRTVTVSGRALEAEFLIVALGAELTSNAIPGLAASGPNIYTLAGAEAAQAALARFNRGRLVVLSATPAYKCPAAPYEAAMLADQVLRGRGVRGRCEIIVYAAEAAPMGVAGAAVSAGVRRMIESKGIAYFPENQVQEVEIPARRVTFTSGLQPSYDLLLHVPPHRVPGVVREAGLVGESGWVDVDRRSLATRFPHVYAIGDVTSIPLALGKPLPKAGVFAERQAEVVAREIVREITGHGRPATFDGHGACFVEAGDGKAAYGKGDFYAEPLPQVTLHRPGRRWHLGKVIHEKRWFWRWF